MTFLCFRRFLIFFAVFLPQHHEIFTFLAISDFQPFSYRGIMRFLCFWQFLIFSRFFYPGIMRFMRFGRFLINCHLSEPGIMRFMHFGQFLIFGPFLTGASLDFCVLAYFWFIAIFLPRHHDIFAFWAISDFWPFSYPGIMIVLHFGQFLIFGHFLTPVSWDFCIFGNFLFMAVFWPRHREIFVF